MNILALGEFPPKTQTGVSISNKLVSEVLTEAGHRVSLIEEYSWKKGGLFTIFHYLGIYFKFLFRLTFTKIDILYFNLPLSFAAQLKIFPVIILSKIKPGLKRIAHLHRGDFSTYIRNCGGLQHHLLKNYLKSTYRLIVLSEIFKKEVLEYYKNLEISVLANTSEFEGTPPVLKNNYKASYTCISNYIESKGIKDLVKCFMKPEFQDLTLNLYGGIYDKKLYTELQKTSTPNIKLHGELHRNEVKNVLQSNDCLIIPSWNEGQPIIILEAMSLGIPVIATGVGDIPQMLEDWPYLVKPKDQHSLEEKVLNFHNSIDKEKLGDQILNMYRSNYAFEKYKVHLETIFDF